MHALGWNDLDFDAYSLVGKLLADGALFIGHGDVLEELLPPSRHTHPTDIEEVDIDARIDKALDGERLFHDHDGRLGKAGFEGLHGMVDTLDADGNPCGNEQREHLLHERVCAGLIVNDKDVLAGIGLQPSGHDLTVNEAIIDATKNEVVNCHHFLPDTWRMRLLC